MTPRLTTADAVVGSLIAHGVDTVFAIPGVQTYHLFDAFHRNADHLRVIGPRHEQTTAYMAFGYAKSTGREGVYSVVPGPGILNAGAALCSAHGASTPILCLTGQVPTAFIGSGKGHLHELPDQLATLRTLTKWAARIEHPTQATDLTAEAFRHMRTGRPRPVALEIPWDVCGQQADMAAPGPAAVHAPLAPDPAEIDRAVALLRNAKNPLATVGSGAMAASAEVLALAERLQAPVVSFRGGRGVVSDEHPLGFNCAQGFLRWDETDVVVGIGSRLELQWFRWPKPRQPMKLVNIDIDPTQIPRLNPDVGIVSDARLGARALDEALAAAGVRNPSRHAEYETIKARADAAVQKVQPHMAFLKAIRAALPRDGFFVEEICQAGFTSYYGLPVYEPRTFVTCGPHGTLGFGFPTALGGKSGTPGRAVVSITGDGGFLFGVQDLATAAAYNLGVVTVLFDNGAYGNVLRDQTRVFGGRVIGAELKNPDFLRLAESFGVHAERARTPDELQRAIPQAIDRDAPALIVVPVDPATEVSPWEFLMPTPYSV